MEALQLSTGRLLNKPIACSFSIERAGYWLKNILLSELALKSTIYYYIPDLNYVFEIKGILHPKMKIMSFFTYPHVVPNP